MGSFSRPRVFDPLDLEIIDRVYEAAWAQLEAREPARDREVDGERHEALRKLVFACAIPGGVDFDKLYDRVLANMRMPLIRMPNGQEELRTIS
ncbi:MAG TPA: hypothetical protein VFP43_22205 [Mesorhizobium sp.]|nr:hypothetical protein [Mesorhizobium sp.]